MTKLKNENETNQEIKKLLYQQLKFMTSNSEYSENITIMEMEHAVK